jgi:hypothetical protein
MSASPEAALASRSARPAAKADAPARVFSPVFHAAPRHWLAGIGLAALGVLVARLLAPSVADEPRARAFVALFGELLALAGLFVIVLGIRRRLARSTPPGTE